MRTPPSERSQCWATSERHRKNKQVYVWFSIRSIDKAPVIQLNTLRKNRRTGRWQLPLTQFRQPTQFAV